MGDLLSIFFAQFNCSGAELEIYTMFMCVFLGRGGLGCVCSLVGLSWVGEPDWGV